MNYNQDCAQIPHSTPISIRSSTTEIPTSISSTFVVENMPALSVFQPTCDKSSNQIDSFSTEKFQFRPNTVEDQDKRSNDFTFKSTIRTEDESECTATHTHTYTDESDPEEIVDYSRNESMVKNVEPCIIGDENDSIFHEEFMRESNFEQKTLCPSTKTAVADVMFMCLVLGLRHNLSWEAQIDMLKMFNAIYGDNTIKVTKDSYLKLLDTERENISFHIYCPDCEIYLGKKKELKGNEICTSCNADINISDSLNFFVSVSLESQLQKLTKDNDFVHAVMNHRFNRNNIKEDALEDLYDGDEYKKHFEKEGILSSPYNFSYSFFTDGIHTGKSNNKTLWPIYLTINELPISERNKYVLLAGLYILIKMFFYNHLLMKLINFLLKASDGFVMIKKLLVKLFHFVALLILLQGINCLIFNHLLLTMVVHSVTKSQNAHGEDKDLQFQFILLKKEH